MREDGVDQFFLGRLEPHGNDETLDELSHLGPNHMCADQLARLGIEDRLDETVRLPERDGLAVSGKGKAADLDLASLLLGFGFRKSDARNLRVAVRTAGDL